MSDNTELLNHDQSWMARLINTFKVILTPERDLSQGFDFITEEVASILACDHVFLSRYNAKQQQFTAISWQSNLNPSKVVSLEQKFMGNMYVEGKTVASNDLSHYSKQLHRTAGRMALLSMIGIPLVTQRGVIGVLEVFSKKLDHFTEADRTTAIMLAKYITLVLEKVDREQEATYLATENYFLQEVIEFESTSIGTLLYKLGESFHSLLTPDGLLVFGIEPDMEGNNLQEVMVQGFDMTSLGKLKEIISKEFLAKILGLLGTDGNRYVVKQVINLGELDGKTVYILPVIWQKSLQGIVLFHWEIEQRFFDNRVLEDFTRRVLGHIATILDRKKSIHTMQQINFADKLTGLADRRVFDYILGKEFKKAQREQISLSVVILELDSFNAINEQYGYLIGDLVLEQLGTLVKENVRSKDTPARYSGGKVAIIMPDTEEEEAVALAEHLYKIITEKKFAIAKKDINVFASMGGCVYIARYCETMTTMDNLVEFSEMALEQAKEMSSKILIIAGCAR